MLTEDLTIAKKKTQNKQKTKNIDLTIYKKESGYIDLVCISYFLQFPDSRWILPLTAFLMCKVNWTSILIVNDTLTVFQSSQNRHFTVKSRKIDGCHDFKSKESIDINSSL